MSITAIRVLGAVAAIAATAVANRALRAAWRTTMKEDPPADSAHHPALGVAVAWVVLSAATMAVTQMFVRRGLSSALERRAA